MRQKLLILFLCVVCLTVFVRKLLADHEGGRTVLVSVQTSDNSGGILHYQWRSTDGKITNVNAATTSWELASGPGLHFAYVLVSNGLGGYTERRLAINTDSFVGEDESDSEDRLIKAPPAPAQQGDYYRSFVAVDQANQPDGTSHDSYAPDVAVYLQDQNSANRYPANSMVSTNLKGEYVIPGVPAGSYSAKCSFAGTAFECTNTGVASLLSDASGNAVATTDYAEPLEFLQVGPITGHFTLSDPEGAPCGTANEFFGVESTATATLLDASRTALATVRVNEFGDYSLPFNSHAASVLLQCENAAPVVVAISALNTSGATFLNPATVAGVTPPTVTGMSATLNGRPLTANTSPAALFLPPHTQFPGDVPPTDFPSNILARSDGFLASKGLDTRLGACEYYKAVGVVEGCDAAGNLIDAINYDQWQRAVKIGKFATGGVPTFSASYINKVDLNLARVHQSISYGPNQTAAVVCNHLGVPITTAADFLSPAQSEVDTAVDNAVHNKNLVACVAMDYTVSPSVNNNQPFIRFLIFGPNGQLLPSINLDERREKFVPGTCVVCHGGDHYAGKFPENGSGFANVGGHFLPYDVGNFEFSSKPGLTKCEQQEAIFNLNQNVLKAGPTAAENDLISGWYAKGLSQCALQLAHVLDESFVPPSWQNVSTAATDFYKNVNARSCRTCHVAMIEGYNFDHFANVPPGGSTNRFPSVDDDLRINLCGGSGQFERDHMMPNSLNTFNRFWLSDVPQANTSGLPNQPTLFANLYTGAVGYCGTSPGSTP